MASNGSPADGLAVAGAADGAHHDIARDIGQQVEMMILDAKHASETKVGKEIGKIKSKMEAMNEKIESVRERVGRLEPSLGGALLRSDLHKSITKLEEVWEGEVSTLKHELWQTIQAHNHNADLLKHHKDAIDSITSRMVPEGPASPELEQVHAQLMQVDKIMQRETAKEQQIDQLMQRLTLVQQQLAPWIGRLPEGAWQTPPTAAAGAGLQTPSPFSAVPGGALQLAGGAAAAAGKKVQRKAANGTAKTTKGAKAPSAAGAASFGGLTLRAEAPEFVPTTSGWSES